MDWLELCLYGGVLGGTIASEQEGCGSRHQALKFLYAIHSSLICTKRRSHWFGATQKCDSLFNLFWCIDLFLPPQCLNRPCPSHLKTSGSGSWLGPLLQSWLSSCSCVSCWGEDAARKKVFVLSCHLCVYKLLDSRLEQPKSATYRWVHLMRKARERGSPSGARAAQVSQAMDGTWAKVVCSQAEASD